MTKSLIPYCCHIRRAFARNCRIDKAEVSSMNSGALVSFPAAPGSLGKSLSAINPRRMCLRFSRAREHSMRRTSDSAVISKLKIPTGSFSYTATCSAMFIASDVLLMLGRAAITIIRSEEHTSELQSRLHLVCRLLLEKKKNNIDRYDLY